MSNQVHRKADLRERMDILPSVGALPVTTTLSPKSVSQDTLNVTVVKRPDVPGAMMPAFQDP
jgi:hypothetical protein